MQIPSQYESLSPTEVAKLLGITRPAVYQLRRRQAGLCRYCDEPALPELSVCKAHRTQRNTTRRQRTGSSPWKPGGRGRPPIKTK